MLDLAIVNGLVVTADGQARMEVGVSEGKIALTAAPGLLPDAERSIDAAGQYVLPGVIDSHYHCRAPANPEREDFGSGTRAAAGGVTTVLEMPISKPPIRDGTTLAARRSHADRNAYVDVGFYSSSATLDEGALAFKAFLQEIPPGREEEFTGLCIYHHDEILRALDLVRPTGMPSIFHAEDYETYTYLEKKLREAGRKDIAAHWEWRPEYVEAISVSTLILLAEATRTRVHLAHISSALTVSLIRDGKRRGAPVTAETCPQYLSLNRATLEQHGPFAKCNPPLKTEADNAALWEGLLDGTIDTVATDHSPFTVPEKEVGWDDIWLAPPGFLGVEILTPFMLTAAADGKLPLVRAVELITSAPAEIFGLTPCKGNVTPGADADITLYDPTGQSETDTTTWQTRSAACARVWQGFPVTGHVTATVLRGTVIYEDGSARSPGR